ncbi:MAG TPA: MarR family transcriptional regulator [Anaerolineales bacterium]|nr:MarR family transcriptional regulator [Anaerolineales bacterium]
MTVSTDLVAREILDVVPLAMRTIRAEMRSSRSSDLTVPLFRTLHFLERHPGASLQDLAGHLGLTSPTACKIVDGLVDHALVARQPSRADRRKITLALTPAGSDVLEKSRASTQARLVELLTPLSSLQLETVFRAMELLQPLFLTAGSPLIREEVKP